VQPSLVQACFNGDPDEVRAILYKKEDVNYQVVSGVNVRSHRIRHGTVRHAAPWCAIP